MDGGTKVVWRSSIEDIGAKGGPLKGCEQLHSGVGNVIGVEKEVNKHKRTN